MTPAPKLQNLLMNANEQFRVWTGLALRLSSPPRLQSVIAIIEQQLMHHCACLLAASSSNLCLLACGLQWCTGCCFISGLFVAAADLLILGQEKKLLLQNCRFILSAQFPHITLLHSSSHKKWIMDPISGDYFKSCTLSRQGSKGQKFRLKSVDGL